MISDKLGDLVYALICGGQHMFGMLKADLLYVCRVSKPCLVLDDPVEKIGRASCRERVCLSV